MRYKKSLPEAGTGYEGKRESAQQVGSQQSTEFASFDENGNLAPLGQ